MVTVRHAYCILIYPRKCNKINPILGQCWSSVCDAAPTLTMGQCVVLLGWRTYSHCWLRIVRRGTHDVLGSTPSSLSFIITVKWIEHRSQILPYIYVISTMKTPVLCFTYFSFISSQTGIRVPSRCILFKPTFQINKIFLPRGAYVNGK